MATLLGIALKYGGCFLRLVWKGRWGQVFHQYIKRSLQLVFPSPSTILTFMVIDRSCKSGLNVYKSSVCALGSVYCHFLQLLCRVKVKRSTCVGSIFLPSSNSHGHPSLSPGYRVPDCHMLFPLWAEEFHHHPTTITLDTCVLQHPTIYRIRSSASACSSGVMLCTDSMYL